MHPLDSRPHWDGKGFQVSEAKFTAIGKPRSTFPVEPRAEAGKGMGRSHKFDHCDSQDASICQFSRNLHENVLDCHQARRSPLVFTPLRVGWPPTPQVYFGP